MLTSVTWILTIFLAILPFSPHPPPSSKWKTKSFRLTLLSISYHQKLLFVIYCSRNPSKLNWRNNKKIDKKTTTLIRMISVLRRLKINDCTTSGLSYVEVFRKVLRVHKIITRYILWKKKDNKLSEPLLFRRDEKVGRAITIWVGWKSEENHYI